MPLADLLLALLATRWGEVLIIISPVMIKASHFRLPSEEVDDVAIVPPPPCGAPAVARDPGFSDMAGARSTPRDRASRRFAQDNSTCLVLINEDNQKIEGKTRRRFLSTTLHGITVSPLSWEFFFLPSLLVWNHTSCAFLTPPSRVHFEEEGAKVR